MTLLDLVALFLYAGVGRAPCALAFGLGLAVGILLGRRTIHNTNPGATKARR